ncbi:MAG: ABC transporter permease [Candidatus Hodarchaeota archaeon]
MQQSIIDGIIQAFILLFTGDPYIWSIIFLSLRVTATATLFASLIGIPIGIVVGMNDFFGKRVIVSLINTLMGFPPVVVGLIVFLALSRSGLFGALGLLFTPTAIIIGQMIIAAPIIAGITMAAVSSIDVAVIETAKSLGAARTQTWFLILKEARIGIFSGIAIGFGQSISEVGASMIVGGNIEGFTRVLTTAVVLETRQGSYGSAIALGLMLMIIAFIINSLILTRLQFNVKGTAGRKLATVGRL